MNWTNLISDTGKDSSWAWHTSAKALASEQTQWAIIGDAWAQWQFRVELVIESSVQRWNRVPGFFRGKQEQKQSHWITIINSGGINYGRPRIWLDLSTVQFSKKKKKKKFQLHIWVIMNMTLLTLTEAGNWRTFATNIVCFGKGLRWNVQNVRTFQLFNEYLALL